LIYLLKCSGSKYHLFIAPGTENVCLRAQIGVIFFRNAVLYSLKFTVNMYEIDGLAHESIDPNRVAL
jgi:hypothetical protein